MNRTFTSESTMPREMVGLSANRPFRFCTMRWSKQAPFSWEQPGDDPDPYPEKTRFLGQRAIELFTPETAETCYIAPHRHEFYEIVLIRDGCAQHLTSAGEYPLTRGDVIIVTPAGIHGFDGIRGLVKTNIYLQPDWLFQDLQVVWRDRGLIRQLLADTLFERSIPHDVRHIRTTESEMAACERELDDITVESRKGRPSLVLFNACFLKILWAIDQAYLRQDDTGQLPLRREIWTGARLIEQMVASGEPFDLGHLASEAGMSGGGFSRLFKETTGSPPMDHYQRRRVEVAARLLREPFANVTEVAHRLGFSDASHLGRMFKRFHAMSPGAFRRQRA